MFPLLYSGTDLHKLRPFSDGRRIHNLRWLGARDGSAGQATATVYSRLRGVVLFDEILVIVRLRICKKRMAMIKSAQMFIIDLHVSQDISRPNLMLGTTISCIYDS